MARRSGLGRGLGALIPGSDESASTSGSSTDAVIDLRDTPFREVPIDDIVANTYQPRRHIDDDELGPLADSIAELGVLQPILVRPSGNTYELIAGERRWRASRKAGLKKIPVLVRQADDLHSLEEALVENLHRRDLNPLDEAAAYRQLIDDFSMTHDEVGKRVGKSRASITNLLRLLGLTPKVQRLLSDGKLAEGHARALLGTDDIAFQTQLAERAVREGMSVRAVEDTVRLRNELAKPTAKKRKGASMRTSAPALEWQERLTNSLDTRVTISVGGRRGKIVIDFADVDDLDRLAQMISAGGGADQPE